MNYADARIVANRLENNGYRSTGTPENADVIILQTCTVRQQAEDKAFGRLESLRPLKKARPEVTLAMMGCIVGVKGNKALEKRYPYVDLWMPPATDGAQLITHLYREEDLDYEQKELRRRHAIQDGEITLPIDQRGNLISAPVSIVYGCSHACTFCIIPQRRGIERTRPVEQITEEVRGLVSQGVREVVLLGQIVDRYGSDIPDGPDLADLLEKVSEIDELSRIRFLTSHPNYMTDRILHAVANLSKVMPQIEVPVQAGDDVVLENMKRGYTVAQYRLLVERIRSIVPEAAIHNDIIVGFPGESDEQFQNTYLLLEELLLDKIHIARYSPRPGTVSARRMVDDIPDQEKRRRFHALDQLQKEISVDKMAKWLGKSVEVLVEDRHNGRWRGRSPQGKLVFFDDEREMTGRLVDVRIEHTGPWSMSGPAADKVKPTSLPESIQLNVF